jgi:outer membrane lipoprotein SlyB
MRKIIFANSNDVNFGRGKDKKKRKSRTLLTDAKDFVVGAKNAVKEANIKSPKDLVDIYNRRKDRSSIGTNSLTAIGATLGARQAMKTGTNPTLGALSRAYNLSFIGAAVDRRISKEKARFRKEGARTRLGKIANDTRVGAASAAGTYALDGAFKQVMQPGSPKSKALKAVAGAIYGGIKGAAIGGTIGSGVGTVRGFVQPNKKKSILQRLKDKK